MEVVAAVPLLLNGTDDLERFAPRSCVENVVKCVGMWTIIDSQEGAELYGVSCVTKQGYLLQFGKEKCLLRGCFVANFDPMPSEVDLVRFRSSDLNWYVVVFYRHQTRTSGECQAFQEVSNRFFNVLNEKDVIRIRAFDFEGLGTQQLEIVSNAKGRFVTDFNDADKPLPIVGGDDESGERNDGCVGEALKHQTEQVQKMLKKATQEVTDHEESFQTIRVKLSGSNRAYITEKELLTLAFDSRGLVAHDGPVGASEKTSPILRTTKTLQLFVKGKLILVYFITWNGSRSLKLTSWNLLSKEVHLNDPACSPRDFSYDATLLPGRSIAASGSGEVFKEELLNRLLEIDDRECPLGRLDSEDGIWLVQQFNPEEFDTYLPLSTVIQGVFHYTIGGEVLQLHLPSVEIQLNSKCYEIHDLPSLMCLIGTLKGKSLHLQSFLTELTSLELRKIFIEKMDFREFQPSDILVNLGTSQGNMVVMLGVGGDGGDGRNVTFQLYGEDDCAFKRFVVNLYAHMEADVELTVRGEEDHLDGQEAVFERKRSALLRELSCCDDLLAQREKTFESRCVISGSKDAIQSKKLNFHRRAPRSCIRKDTFLKIRKMLDDMEIETDKAFAE